MIAGEYALSDFRTARPVFGHILNRYLSEDYSPEMVSETCGVPAHDIRRIANEMATAAFDHNLELPIAWTDSSGVQHASMKARPVSMHAMRGISAHANGFQTCRALASFAIITGRCGCARIVSVSATVSATNSTRKPPG